MKMDCRWTKAHNLLVESNLNKSFIELMVRESNVRLRYVYITKFSIMCFGDVEIDCVLRFYREGCQWFFQNINKHKVPLLIFSAGVGDVIEEVVRQQSHMYDNLTIVSNYMDFNHQVGRDLL